MNDTNKRVHQARAKWAGAKMDRLTKMRAYKAGLMTRTAAIAVLSACTAFASAEAKEYKAWLDIPAQSLEAALKEFGVETDSQVLFAKDVVVGRTSVQVKGVFTPREALALLTRDTGLRIDQSADSVFLIKSATAAAVPQTTAQAPAPSQPTDSAQEDQPKDGDEKGADDRKVERVVVTGTHIRGKHPKSSPLETFTKKDIDRSGATTTEQFVGKLPQNMGTRTQFATGARGGQNNDATTGVDLRGLGLGTTLVLVNGRRLGLSDLGRSADVSLIPVSAIERVEVLSDGASAIYGSDAIGGVINFILRDDFDGAETRLSYGGASGGLQQADFTQTVGTVWGSGHALASYNFFSATPLDVTDRDYSRPAIFGNLTPDDTRHSVLASFSQDLGEHIVISGDVVFSSRDVTNNYGAFTASNPLSHFKSLFQSYTEQTFANLELDYQVSESLNASVVATYSKVDVDGAGALVFFNRVPPLTSPLPADKDYTGLDFMGTLDGRLFELGGGDVRFVVGAGVLEEEYQGVSFVSVPSVGPLGRRTTYAFGELYLPLVGEEQDVPFIHRLEVNLAARHTIHTDDSTPSLNTEFGDSTDPKVGLFWSPFDSLDFRATYGTSFRAPSLTELDPTSASNFLIGTSRIPSPSGPLATRIQIANYADPNLRPETAETFTVGFDYRAPFLEGLRLNGTYYNISYSDRIGVPPGGAAILQNPAGFPEAIYRPSSVAMIEDILRTTTNQRNDFLAAGVDLSDPHAAAEALFAMANVWIVDQRSKNLAISEQDGFDLGASGRFDVSWGEIRLGANVTRILSYRQQSSPSSVIVSNVDRLAQPVDLRGRAYAGFSYSGLDATLSLNYVDDYFDPFVVPRKKLENWTTADLSLTYDLGREGAGLLEGVRVDLSVQNLFDEEPPAVPRDPAVILLPVGFDPANANPLGRFVMVGVSKTW